MTRKLNSPKQVCVELDCGISSFYNLLNSGALQAVKMLGKTMVTDEELQRYRATLPPYEPGNSHLAGKPRKSRNRKPPETEPEAG